MAAGGVTRETVRRAVRWAVVVAFAGYALSAGAGMLQLPRYLFALLRGDVHP
ncbi:hypothetical protein ACFY00_18305 [Kitasatospora sp. NPDC001540]|uniref:hypothetical protein n=1 Tax=Kitasatospora sp. NPDC001540 TaxID=3364014 RepID=UPI00368FC09F